MEKIILGKSMVVAVFSRCIVIPIYADSVPNKHINDTKISGEFKAVDEAGNTIIK